MTCIGRVKPHWGAQLGQVTASPNCAPHTHATVAHHPERGALVLKTHATSTRAQLAGLTGLIADTDTQDAPARLPVTLSSYLSLLGPAERAGTQIHLCTHTLMQTHARAHTCIRAHLRTCAHTRAHTCAHTLPSHLHCLTTASLCEWPKSQSQRLDVPPPSRRRGDAGRRSS